MQLPSRRNGIQIAQGKKYIKFQVSLGNVIENNAVRGMLNERIPVDVALKSYCDKANTLRDNYTVHCRSLAKVIAGDAEERDLKIASGSINNVWADWLRSINPLPAFGPVITVNIIGGISDMTKAWNLILTRKILIQYGNELRGGAKQLQPGVGAMIAKEINDPALDEDLEAVDLLSSFCESEINRLGFGSAISDKHAPALMPSPKR